MEQIFRVYLAKEPTYKADPFQCRTNAGLIIATSLSNAFYQTQACINPNWEHRSTSVGDAFEDIDGNLFMVCDSSFEEIPNRILCRTYATQRGLVSMKTTVNRDGKDSHQLIKDYLWCKLGTEKYNKILDELFDEAIDMGSMGFYNAYVQALNHLPEINKGITEMIHREIREA